MRAALLRASLGGCGGRSRPLSRNEAGAENPIGEAALRFPKGDSEVEEEESETNRDEDFEGGEGSQFEWEHKSTTIDAEGSIKRDFHGDPTEAFENGAERE